MGRKLDALLGKRFNKSYKLRALINLSLSRLAILKNQRQSRYSLARSDVIELLNLGHHERALFRVELVIKEQNMLDALAMIEGYCSLVMERVSLIQQEEKECPEELKEAVSSLIYASSRTGEFPELKQMRSVFTSRFGNDFTARSIELRNNCTVNLKMIQKLSTRQPSLDSRLKALEEIASDNKIDLALILDECYDHPASKPVEEKKKNNTPADDQIDHVGPPESLSPNSDIHEDLTKNSLASRRKKYRDVAVSAEEAFQSATNAAAAAKAAVELSRFGRPPSPHNFDDEQQINLGRRAEDSSEANKDNGNDDDDGEEWRQKHLHYTL